MKNHKKGLVLEVKKGSVIVLTPEGEFLEQKIKDKTPEIGSEIIINSSKFFLNWKKWSILSVAALLLLVFLPYSIINTSAAIAYVSVDINPSIELGINKKEIVVDAYAFNEDGRHLLKNIKIINLPLEQALTIITEEAIKEKYINSNKENVVLITFSKENSNYQEIENTIKKVIETNKQNALVKLIQVDPQIREQARKAGVSSGKYTLIEEAYYQGLKIPQKEIKNKSVFRLIKEAGGNPEDLLSSFEKKKNNKKNDKISNKPELERKKNREKEIKPKNKELKQKNKELKSPEKINEKNEKKEQEKEIKNQNKKEKGKPEKGKKPEKINPNKGELKNKEKDYKKKDNGEKGKKGRGHDD